MAARHRAPNLELPNSYWAATAALAPETPALAGSVRADVCVIGGGFLGLSAALHLAERGANVVLLEAGEPGWGASGRNGGQIIAGFKAERSELVRRLGEERGERLFNWSGGFPDLVLELIAKHKIDCGASQPGWLQPAHSVESLAAYRTRTEEWQKRGVAVDLLDANAAAGLLGTNWYKGAYFDPRGGRLQPLSYARGLARAAIAKGATIFSRTAALQIDRLATGFRVVTEAGDVTAERVLVCTNAYSDLLGSHGLHPGLVQSVVPVMSYMLATQPLGDNLRRSILPGGQTAADLKRLTNHFRIETDGRLLFGGRGGLSEGGGASNFRPLLSKLQECFPQLGDVSIDYTWGGRVALTLDHLPHLHELQPGLYAALGCNGRGVGMASNIGKVVADLFSGGTPRDCPIPTTQLKRIPFHSLRLPGLHAAVFWKAFRDRQDHRRS